MDPSAFVKKFELPPHSQGALSSTQFAVKDLIDIKNHITGCGNPTWAKTHKKSTSNAVCIEQLLSSGATCVGKTISDELAFSLLGENHFLGTPLNPKAPDRVPGGSSSGSASAVASGLVDFALGTDTGGSTRVPASNCGIWGLRPSYGRISVAGVFPFAPSFDTVGILAKNGEILEKVATALLASAPKSAKGKIYFLEEMLAMSDPEVSATFLKEFPHLPKISLEEIASPISLLETFCQIQWAEIWSSLGTWIENAKPEFGPRTAKNFELAKNIDRSHIQKHLIARELFAKELNTFLQENRFLCIPTTPALAPKLKSIGTDRSSGTYYPRTLTFCSIAGLARLPQVSIPLLTIDDIPLGISLIGAHGSDMQLLQIARNLT